MNKTPTTPQNNNNKKYMDLYVLIVSTLITAVKASLTKSSYDPHIEGLTIVSIFFTIAGDVLGL